MFIRTIDNGQGSALNQFSNPRRASVLPSGVIVVADGDNHRLQFVKEDGTFIKSIGNGQGVGHNQFNVPHCIARLPNGILVVGDWKNKRLQFLQEDGTFLGSFGGGHCSSIAVLPDGSLVASNHDIHCLDVLS